jgi:hypothetical protein
VKAVVREGRERSTKIRTDLVAIDDKTNGFVSELDELHPPRITAAVAT